MNASSHEAVAALGIAFVRLYEEHADAVLVPEPLVGQFQKTVADSVRRERAESARRAFLKSMRKNI